MRRNVAVTLLVVSCLGILVACGGKGTPVPTGIAATQLAGTLAPGKEAATVQAIDSASSSVAVPGAPKTAGVVIVADEKDFEIALDTHTIPAGPVTFRIKNVGPSPHDFGVVQGGGASKEKGITGQVLKKSETMNANQTAALTLDLPPGTYDVVSTVSGDVQHGMIAMLTVR